MNDFGIDIMGLKGALKKRSFNLKDKQRTVTVESGAGCVPDPAYRRRIVVRWEDGTHDTISSYDLEYVIKDGKKIYQIEPEKCEVDIA